MFRFSPIKNKEQLMAAVEYVATETSKLAEKVIGEKLSITSLTIFSHYQNEYESLVKILADMGLPYNENNGPRVSLHEPIVVGTNHITHLRIRIPDQNRPQVGCNDFDTTYESFKRKYLSAHSKNLQLIVRPAYEMIELSDSDFDVLAYVISN